jgi:integrase
MTCITYKAGNRHTTRHHRRKSSALESARQNRYTDPLHTASAERRHRAATRWLRDGVPIEVVSTLLGHSSVSVTSSVYGHLTAEDARAALEKAGWLAGREVSW